MARISLELGLHRQNVLLRAYVDKRERANAVNTFWAIYVLDRQLSYGLGLPKILQDADLDANLPDPVSAWPSNEAASQP